MNSADGAIESFMRQDVVANRISTKCYMKTCNEPIQHASYIIELLI